uniref:Uncharacterized protein n=1 Tax=Anguilla anguilla TaxID=7936 RepID=A0A0E9RBB0_ANGAN
MQITPQIQCQSVPLDVRMSIYSNSLLTVLSFSVMRGEQVQSRARHSSFLTMPAS